MTSAPPQPSTSSSQTKFSLDHLLGLPAAILQASLPAPLPPVPNLTLSPVALPQRSSGSILSFPGWALSTSLFLPQSSSSLMWTPPKPPPIFPEPTSGGFIPSQNLLMAHSIAFTIWPPPVPFYSLPYSQCSLSHPPPPHQHHTICRSLQIHLLLSLFGPWKSHTNFKS